jgi:hypothetical protein
MDLAETYIVIDCPDCGWPTAIQVATSHNHETGERRDRLSCTRCLCVWTEASLEPVCGADTGAGTCGLPVSHDEPCGGLL